MGNTSETKEKKVKAGKLDKKIMGCICIAVIIFAVVLDQITKYMALTDLKDAPAHVLIDGVLELYFIVNTGSSWGMLAGQKILILCISLVIIILCTYLIVKSPADTKFIPFNISLAMIIAGGIGNGIDRIRFSYVIDFIYFKLINFPVFNVADIFVTCGAFCFIFLVLFKYKENDLYFMKPGKRDLREN